MAQINANKLIDFIKLYFPEDATEISDALDLLSLALDGLLSSTNTTIAEFHKNKDFDKGMELWEFSKSVAEIQGEINEYSTLISIDAEIDEEEPEEEPDEIEEQRTIPNYSDYAVDSSIPHTLYEDFNWWYHRFRAGRRRTCACFDRKSAVKVHTCSTRIWEGRCSRPPFKGQLEYVPSRLETHRYVPSRTGKAV
jgi:hypothetical protein